MDNNDCEGPVITLKPRILIHPVLFSYINNSYYSKVIFPLCTSKEFLQETAKKMGSINTSLRPCCFHTLTPVINLLMCL